MMGLFHYFVIQFALWLSNKLVFSNEEQETKNEVRDSHLHSYATTTTTKLNITRSSVHLNYLRLNNMRQMT